MAGRCGSDVDADTAEEGPQGAELVSGGMGTGADTGVARVSW